MDLTNLLIKAVVFDWAGTLIDPGSCAPAGVFQEVFAREGVAISMAEAREPMGMAKRDHIAAIASMPTVAERWVAAHAGAGCDDADIDRMYDAFMPLQCKAIEAHSDLVPGALEALAELRERGIKLGSSTGYNRVLADLCVEQAKQRGLTVDASFCADDVPAARPAPWMIYANMQALGVYPPAVVVKVDDTVIGLDAAHHAGCWAVGVVRSGNELGLDEAQIAELDSADLADRLETGRRRMLDAGAHYAIDSVADLPAVLDQINARLTTGQWPTAPLPATTA